MRTYVTCPSCQRVLQVDTVTESPHGIELRVEVAGSTLPAPCCQKHVTDNYTKVAIFITNPEVSSYGRSVGRGRSRRVPPQSAA